MVQGKFETNCWRIKMSFFFLMDVYGIKSEMMTVYRVTSLICLKYPDQQLFPSFPASIFRATQWQMNERLYQSISCVCSRWGVKMSTRGPRALCFRDWTFVIVFAAGRWQMGAAPAIRLEKQISDWARAGHLQLQAFSSQAQKHFSYRSVRGREDGGRSVPVTFIFEAKALSSHDSMKM